MKLYLSLFSLLFITFYSCNSDTVLLSETMDSQVTPLVSSRSLNATATKVFLAPGAITIDGDEGEWHDVPKRHLKEVIDLGSTIDNKFDLSTYCRMLWDEENLYFFARITDQDINTNAEFIYDMDGLEIYIDGDNSKNAASGPPVSFPPPAYDDNDDFFRFIPGESSALSAWEIIDGSNFEFALVPTDSGYNVEVKMPFSSLPGMIAEAGHEFGLEFQVNDNDFGTRESILKWNSSSDNSYFDPSLFGTAILFDAIAQ